MEKRELFYATGRNVNLVQLLCKRVWMFLKIELLFDPTIPLLSIYPEKNITGKDTCTPVFIASLLTIARQGSNLNAHQQREG